MNVFKWSNPRYYVCFSPDGDGAPASSAASPSGDGGGGSSVASTPSAGDSDGSSGTTTPATPSASPATPSASPSLPEPGGWDMLGSSDDLDHLELQAQEAVPPTPPAATPAPQAPAAAPTPQPQAPQAPQTPPTSPDQTTPAPGAQAPAALSPSNPVAIAEAMAANRDSVIAHLAQDRFALSPEDIQELEENAAAFVPKMMARVAYEAQVSMMKFLAQSVPGMVKQYNTVQKANTEAEDKFFSAHEKLGLKKSDPKHREVAFRMASLYRQANPQMPLEQLIAEVGPIVAAAVQAQAPAAPAAPSAPPSFRPAPFTPAVNGGGGMSPTPAPTSPWEGMGANYDD